MRKFIVNVNGNSYEVEVEEVSSNGAAPIVQSAPVVNEAKKSAPSNGTSINAPMPGNILKINVKPGDKVKSGDVLVVLEAMKMENDIVAPNDATVSEVLTSVGSSVDTGDALVSLA